MTSILKVSEIQDPTNSNTALTIDSTGFTNISNHVVNYAVVENAISSTQTITATSFTDITGTTISYTPKASGNTIIVNFVGNFRSYAPSGQDVLCYFQAVIAGSGGPQYKLQGDNLGKLGDVIYFPGFFSITEEYTATGTSAVTFKLTAKAGTGGQNVNFDSSGTKHTITVVEFGQ
jgi:hypothetical protein